MDMLHADLLTLRKGGGYVRLTRQDDVNYVEYYSARGEHHREGDKSAVIVVIETCVIRLWMMNGLRHRENGKPAVTGINGVLGYWEHGVQTKPDREKKWWNENMSIIYPVD
jgi:hypothetical protein